ncbi:TonB-dependent Receptor Plug Domain [Novosphingobium sp. CF614]|uniref:TonB-dependent receptor n=1 Tax=Novosphingobium sp. CF614 TaxID=1884364 RepID=UPI0008F3D608|nr:TonB-dependent receptor [Novosphingobium sp. CF614]SFG35893.1 TonB-dependent Receptor Plug Domain [Novosphingobium sp. CF614]
MLRLASRSLLALAFGVGMATVAQARPATPAPASRDQQAQRFDIPAQPLDLALTAWSQQTGIQLVKAADLRGLRSRTVRGTMSPASALKRLLKDSGYEARFVGINTVAIRRRAADTPLVPRRPSPTSSPESGGHDLIVTGSRLAAMESRAIMPVRRLTRSAIAASGEQDLSRVLLLMGAIQPGFGLQNTENQTSGGAGLSQADLRGLGAARTLVLVNGQRQVGSRRGLSVVDLNTIPPGLVDRVEVVTGGSSAVYGADAVAGVINIILRDHVDGIELSAGGGIAERGYGASYNLSFLAGTALADDRLHLTLGLSYDRLSGVDATSLGRASTGLDLVYASDEPDAPLLTRPGVRFGPFDKAGSFELGGRRYVFLADGSGVRPYDSGTAGTRGGVQLGGDGLDVSAYDQLRIPLSRAVGTILGKAEIGAGNVLSASLRVADSRTRSSWQPVIDPIGGPGIPIAIDNPYLPTSTVDMMRAAGVDRIWVAKVLDGLGRVGSINRRLMIQGQADLTGPLGVNWRYALGGGWGRTEDRVTTINVRDNVRFLQAIDAVRDAATGAIVCRNGRAEGCEPLNILGDQPFDPTARAWVSITPKARETLMQMVLRGNVSGNPAHLAGGPVDLLLGWEYRRETSMRRSSAVQESGGTYLPRVTSYRGAYSVVEGYGEIALPMLSEKPMVERLTATAALRFSRYSTAGRATAWHLGLDYAPVPELRIRAVRSQAVRAPNIGELFSGVQQGFSFITDPCDAALRHAVAERAARCSALGLPADFDGQNGISKLVAYQSNEHVGPEHAATTTLGVTWKPGALPGLALAVDRWRIRIDEAIAFPIEQLLLNDCVDGADPDVRGRACGAIMRDPLTGRIAMVTASISNIGKLETAGIDISTTWRPPWEPGGGRLTVELLATWVERLAITRDVARGIVQRLDGILPNPRWRGTLSTRWEHGPTTIGWTAQFIGSSRITIDSTLTIDKPNTGARTYHDLEVAQKIDPRFTLRFNILNLFDSAPPQRGYNINAGLRTGAIYPNLGRQFRFSVTASL